MRIIDIPRDELYRRCNERFIKMLEAGAVEEVREWWSRGVVGQEASLPRHPTTALLKIIGVPQLLSYLRGETSLGQATQAAQQATRNYAKRQMTWFKHQLDERRTV